jgi:hypothetical protein
VIGNTGGGVTGGGGNAGGMPILTEPAKLVMPLVVLFVTCLMQMVAVHEPKFVVAVWSTPLASGAVFVVVEEEEVLHPGPAEHDGTAPALIRSICESLSRSAPKAFPLNSSTIRQEARNLVISSSQNGLRSRSRGR